MTNNNHEKQLVTIQFKISTDEYADLQRAKANSGNPTQASSKFYRDQLLKSIEKL
jgi:hypothetical protein